MGIEHGAVGVHAHGAEIAAVPPGISDKEPRAVPRNGAGSLLIAPTYDSIRGVRISPAGVPLDPAGIQINAVGSAFGHPRDVPALAFDGTNYMAVE